MKAHELLSDPSKWTQDHYARDRSGISVHPHYPGAICWCALGAIEKCYPSNEALDVMLTLEAHLRHNTHDHSLSIAIWNDNSTYEEVIQTLKGLDI